MTIFVLWISFWILSTIILLVSPFLRRDIESLDILPAIYTISGIWIPALSCLAGFWFPQQEKSKALRVTVTKEKALAALVLSGTYLAFVLVLILYSTFFITANTETADAGDITLLGQLTASVKIGLVVSPIALAPISWLTSSTVGEAKSSEVKPA
jgi:hypothetical protein